MRKNGKRYREELKQVEARVAEREALGLDEALAAIKDMNRTKFDQSVEIVLQLGIDPKQADQMIRGSVSLPKGVGKTKRVVAFCDEASVETARQAGAIEAGGDELVKKIQDGWTDFDVAVAQPQMMSKVGRLGRILGPQGKMPSPKSGTVTPDIETAVKEYAAGKLAYRNDDGGNIHAIVGKASFTAEDLKENIEAFVNHIKRSRPAAAKGTFIRKVYLSASMSPSVRLAVA
ncbi:MAG TPA: 50S ribosomal protein L1 [Phycisphaerae bacterium]|nr:50S ribosomal protein L1 [Phycisphaerae bacterium]